MVLLSNRVESSYDVNYNPHVEKDQNLDQPLNKPNQNPHLSITRPRPTADIESGVVTGPLCPNERDGSAL